METFKIDNVIFYVSEGVLINVRDPYENAPELVIPEKTPNGESITAIGESCFKNECFQKVIMPKSITVVAVSAFRYSFVGEVVWSSGCKKIPAKCFENSNLKRISNIDHVTMIGDYAFAGSCIEEIAYPSSCSFIALGVFANSSLSKITNIEHITLIDGHAFENSSIKEFFWPENCFRIPNNCFCQCRCLREIHDISRVVSIGQRAFSKTGIIKFRWPDKCTCIPDRCFLSSDISKIENLSSVAKIGDNAFESTSGLTEIDLSGSISLEVGVNPFGSSFKKKIFWPYYLHKMA